MNKPQLEPLDGGHYRLLKPYLYTTNSGSAVVVPKGYTTNGADIPRFFWRLYPPFSPEYIPAVIIHDYLCDTAESMIDKEGMANAFKFADDVFREILLKLGVSKSKVYLFYRAVRLWHTVKLCGE